MPEGVYCSDEHYVMYGDDPEEVPVVGKVLDPRLALSIEDSVARAVHRALDNSGRGEPGEVLSVEEAGKLIGLGRSAASEAVRQGQLPSRRVGARLIVPRRALMRWLEQIDPGEP